MAALDVHIVTPERELWTGLAQMVVAHGVDGDVGILAGHAPLLIRLAIGPLRIQREDGRWEKAVVDGGFMHVASDEEGTRVDVLASQAELVGDIDLVAARARLEQARERAQRDDDAGATAEVERAQARVDAAG